MWFSTSFKEISKQLTGNPPRCETQICTKHIGAVVHLPQWFSVPIWPKTTSAVTPKIGGRKIQWSKNPSNRLRMIPKRLPQSDCDAWQKLPPAATRKVGATKIVVGKLIKFISDNPKAHLFKPFWHLEKNYQYVGDTNRCPFMTSRCLGKKKCPYSSLCSSLKLKIQNVHRKKLQNTSNRFQKCWSI